MTANPQPTNDGNGICYRTGDRVWHREDDRTDPGGPGRIIDLYTAADGNAWAAVRWNDANGREFHTAHRLADLTPH